MIYAICHDSRNIVSGSLKNLSDRGCELISNVVSAGPSFPLRAKIVLDFFEVSTQQSVTLRAMLCGARRSQGAWIYTIRWKRRERAVPF